MSYLRPSNLDGFVVLLARPDVRTRQQVGEDLLAFLGNSNNDLSCEDMGLLVDGLLPWVNGGNFKVIPTTHKTTTSCGLLQIHLCFGCLVGRSTIVTLEC